MSDHLRASTWSNVPKDLIAKIETHLDSSIDMSQLRSVCKTWHTSRNPEQNSILSPFLPRTIPNVNLPFTTRPNAPVTLVARAVFLVQSSDYSDGWLLTVEEIVPCKLRILYPLSYNQAEQLPSNFPKYLDLSKFNVVEVAKSYGFKYSSDCEDVVDVQKVFFCCGSTNPTAVVLYGKGTLIWVRLQDGHWGYVTVSATCLVKDIVIFKGMIYAVDQFLNVSVIDYNTMNVVKFIDCKSTDTARSASGSTHLVEWNRKLYLVEWFANYVKFYVYMFDEVNAQWDSNYCLYDRTILVSSGWCFTADIPGNGMYIVYAGDCFNSRTRDGSLGRYQLFEDTSIDLTVGVFFRFKGENYVDTCWWNTIADWLWPPPNWFLSEKFACTPDDVNDKESPPDLHCAVVPDTIARIHNQDSGVQAVGIDPHTIQIINKNEATMVFEGVNIRANLVPTLQKVWAKHGNILEECKVRNADIIAAALESLATAVMIIKTNTGNSLNKVQVDYLSSVMRLMPNLRHMNFKVEWLVPFVEQALAAHKRKPLKDALINYKRAKDQTAEMKQKVVAELVKIGEVEDRARVSEILHALPSIDFDRCLGDGLYYFGL